MAIIDKRRPQANVTKVMNVIGDVKGKTCIMVDDIVDSAGTLCNAAAALIEAGALKVSAYVTHGVLSGEACDRVNASKLEKLLYTNTIAPTTNHNTKNATQNKPPQHRAQHLSPI